MNQDWTYFIYFVCVCVAHGLSCSVACGIFPDQGSNPCPLHWPADSQPLRHQESPGIILNCFEFMDILEPHGFPNLFVLYM